MGNACFRYLCVILLSIAILTPVSVYAQDATIVGAVTDESKGVIPGATCYSHRSGDRPAVRRRDQRAWRVSARSACPPARYTVQAALDGFAPVSLSGVELLVGQNATINFTLKVATLSEAVTVTGEAALVDTTQARVAGNVDRRQMEELPIAGRNWQQLASMVKGITANTISTRPGVSRDAAFSLNLDGQDITQNASNSGLRPARHQPRRDRRVSGDHESLRRDDGPLDGHSGSGDLAGGHEQPRRKRLRLLPRRRPEREGRVRRPRAARTRIGRSAARLGGPILRDKMHFFGSYEYESEPNTSVYTVSALGGQRFETPTERTAKSGLGRARLPAEPDDSHDGPQRILARLLVLSLGTSHPRRDSPLRFELHNGGAVECRQPVAPSRAEGQLLPLSLAGRARAGRAADSQLQLSRAVARDAEQPAAELV